MAIESHTWEITQIFIGGYLWSKEEIDTIETIYSPDQFDRCWNITYKDGSRRIFTHPNVDIRYKFIKKEEP